LRRSLPTFKVGGQWRFRREDLDKWIDGQKLSHRDSIRFSTFVQDQDAGGLEVR
jgi:hypothetical protein